MEVCENLIDSIHRSFTGGGIHFASPALSLRTNEFDLVRGVLQMLQGLASSLFSWNETRQCFHYKKGIFLNCLSQTSLYRILDQFSYAATCLRLVDIMVNKIEKSKSSTPPTLRAFSCSVSTWLTSMREVALKEEVKINNPNVTTAVSILGLSSSLSSLCAGAEYLFQIVHGAIPRYYFDLDASVPAADIAVHILNHLYMKLNEVCLVDGGEEDAFRMLFYIFVGSLLPYIESLDSWLFQGTLDDPFEEMFFIVNKNIAIEEAEFWEKSCQLKSAMPEKPSLANLAAEYRLLAKDKKDITGRASISFPNMEMGKQDNNKDFQVCPFFFKDIAKAIVSAGKSLQLIRHAPTRSVLAISGGSVENGCSVDELTLLEVFCVSLTALIGDGDHIAEGLWKDGKHLTRPIEETLAVEEISRSLGGNMQSKKVWQKLLDDTLTQKSYTGLTSRKASHNMKGLEIISDELDMLPRKYCPENPAITVCRGILWENRDSWSSLNVSQAFDLPPLNDECLRKAIFHNSGMNSTSDSQFGEVESVRFLEDAKMLEVLLPFPTLLPSCQDDLQISEVLPFQNNCTLPSRTLGWIQNVEPKGTPLPSAILQECLITYIKKQADYIGRTMLSKLLGDWRLLDELGVLRAIYLLGSGDLLQHFLSVIFNKLDKGESLDDDFELNTILQESIRNSADNVLLNTPDSLVVSVNKNVDFSEDEPVNQSVPVSTPRKGRAQSYSMDVLDSLQFTYKACSFGIFVSWPLELIANLEAMKKYNQVMNFLLKVKHAKSVLDKVRRMMWKDRGIATRKQKHHWLLEQKLLHFVDAFHQYVMDRVYHNAWRELCEGVTSAGTLDEVIDAHETYLLSIQRQCFVVPDKLWGLIASRINSILALALDFYSVQQTLSSGGSISAIKARCVKEMERIEKQFDDCMAFLLRILSVKLNVGQFPHLAALVTRINYNNFYMSDGGTRLTVPALSATSRPT
ncbi:Spc97 / Spc98 family of spindle pole body (SBP) component [Striga hermonthica]|uniref:Gamma-tubulin complex component n=1 Tax=Striga hermonthica TaxID=68872 RepID=A0A9N7MBG5_STRHE|nr:Spc97 / Spc98 family of spindle pole body (SBP) component [Striga hermonthica]